MIYPEIPWKPPCFSPFSEKLIRQLRGIGFGFHESLSWIALKMYLSTGAENELENLFDLARVP